VCGIIGYVGQRACKDLLLQGLERLEYRGYDSAGLALREDGELDYVRVVGNLQALKRDGVVVEAGAFVDVSATLVLVRAADEQAALDICREDVYLRNGVWVELRARPFGRVREA